jgi:hypothetical protein
MPDFRRGRMSASFARSGVKVAVKHLELSRIDSTRFAGENKGGHFPIRRRQCHGGSDHPSPGSMTVRSRHRSRGTRELRTAFLGPQAADGIWAAIRIPPAEAPPEIDGSPPDYRPAQGRGSW